MRLRRARVRLRTAGAATLWMAVAEADATALLIVSTQTARQTDWATSLGCRSLARATAPSSTDRIAKISTGLYMAFFKTLALMHAVQRWFEVPRSKTRALPCSASSPSRPC